jgi:hypothetical protein
MKNNKYNTLLLFILVSCLVSSFTISKTLDFTTEVVKNSDKRMDIIVNINSGEPEFTYSIWNKGPWENGREIENSGKTNLTQYSFRNMKIQNYFIMVSDARGSKLVKQVKVSE